MHAHSQDHWRVPTLVLSTVAAPLHGSSSLALTSGPCWVSPVLSTVAAPLPDLPCQPDAVDTPLPNLEI
ncbi:hypothetical protein PF002_g29865 [Phytophthora fragariae]|uniref:Uncharacterized protein n=1 Tax=Phytophthora fragariae TaxID=53985 RepID=A0A6A3DVU1_9STRA|nr:hypothetical protein PF003_g31010 [Phytophthora fragariae]KAE8922580.1 hypothetical protein PF009_g27156 [Phytophthora fragariae]KAE9069280.1 hypothetical protein PF007_g27379 [Phytophthora fragariae]KAE9171265.1 hypothetical protein PF002_g29865 [Phytophthora fragariae]